MLPDFKEYYNKRYVFSYSHPSILTGQYVGKLNATWAEEGAGVINLFTNGPIPQKEIDFLNGVIRQYQQYDLEKKNQRPLLPSNLFRFSLMASPTLCETPRWPLRASNVEMC